MFTALPGKTLAFFDGYRFAWPNKRVMGSSSRDCASRPVCPNGLVDPYTIVYGALFSSGFQFDPTGSLHYMATST